MFSVSIEAYKQIKPAIYNEQSEANELLSTIPEKGIKANLQEQLFFFFLRNRSHKALVLVSWSFLVRTQESHTIPFLDHVPMGQKFSTFIKRIKSNIVM